MSGDPGDDGRGHERRGAALFADIADSTRLFREHGDEGARRIVVAALALGREQVERTGGRVVETIGDELFCELPDATAACAAAVGMLRALGDARRAGTLPRAVSFRVGFASGPLRHDGAGVFGDTVYLAKRVSTAAKAEQAFTTRATLDELAQPELLTTRTVDVLRLKGRVDEVELVEIVWSADATLEVGDGAPPHPSSCDPGTLEVSHAGRTVRVSRQAPLLGVGRGEACELRVDDARVSRLHARVELRKGRFVLVDESRNGCVVHARGAEPVHVRRDVASLDGEGEIALGPDADAPRIAFRFVPPAG